MVCQGYSRGSIYAPSAALDTCEPPRDHHFPLASRAPARPASFVFVRGVSVLPTAGRFHIRARYMLPDRRMRCSSVGCKRPIRVRLSGVGSVASILPWLPDGGRVGAALQILRSTSKSKHMWPPASERTIFFREVRLSLRASGSPHTMSWTDDTHRVTDDRRIRAPQRHAPRPPRQSASHAHSRPVVSWTQRVGWRSDSWHPGQQGCR